MEKALLHPLACPIAPDAAKETCFSLRSLHRRLADLRAEHRHVIPGHAAIQGLCAERGCYFLDLNAEFSDDSGYLLTDYAQPDGVHLTVSGYNKWVSYLCTHVPYNKNNPYQAGSTYYLSDDVKELLADLP